MAYGCIRSCLAEKEKIHPRLRRMDFEVGEYTVFKS
jgi:hypothetical protein